jgi:hypothetical protein
MHRRAQTVVTAVFLAVLFVPLLLFIVGVRPKSIENRALTDYPQFDGGSVLDDETYSTLAAYLTDRLPFRDVAIRADSKLEDAMTLSDPIREGVPRGQDGWLYHPDTLVDTCLGPPPPDYLEELDNVAAQAEEADIPFLYLIAPDKVTIYPDHVPLEGMAGILGLSDDQPPKCNDMWYRALDEAAGSRPWLDPLADEIKSTAGDPDEPMYYRHDTHWTDAGAVHEVRSVVDFIDPKLWNPGEFQPSTPAEKSPGDLARMRGLTDSEETVPGYAIKRFGVAVATSPGPVETPETVRDISHATTAFSKLIPDTTLMIGDSFGRHSIDMLQPYFENLILIDRDYLLEHSIDEVIDEPPTAIIVEQVQRNVTKGWWVDYLGGVSDYLDEQ